MSGNSRKALIASAAALLAVAGALSGTAASAAPAAPAAPALAIDPAASAAGASVPVHTLTLRGGSTLRWSDDGYATVTDKAGDVTQLPLPRSAGRSGLGAAYGPSQYALTTRATASALARGSAAAGATARITPMNTGPVPFPAAAKKAIQRHLAHAPAEAAPADASAVPDNSALSSSFDSYLNAQGVNAVGAFVDDARYLHALPGTGEIITNVSIGDLTDQSMADAGDPYVQQAGPTTIVANGQRYLDIPTLPLIPTYVAEDNGTLNPVGSTEGQDPNLGEVLLDFSMMAPLPDGSQRPGATGSAGDDLLGIAPGAKYRLVVPASPTYAGISQALWAAATQQPRPSVITASLGFGTDEGIGFPGRYLEDDPTIRATLARIVRLGIPVVVSANDGTRLVLPVSVGPDGGATPTDVTSNPQAQTDISDDEPTTIPSRVVDDGVVAAGSTTTDDTLAGSSAGTGTYPETRYDGAASFASGFGSRVDLSAPGDALPSFYRPAGPGVPPQAVEVVLNGGTSASAPEIAAGIADALQAARATGRHLSPAQVRQLLIDTAAPVAQPPQADQTINVGPQLNVTGAVERLLSARYPIATQAVRMSVAERQVVPTNSGTAFEEDTNPDAIDLSGPADAAGQPSGQNAVSPITFGLDMTGAGAGISYRLTIGGHVINSPVPYVRLLPATILADAGQPRTSAGNDRTATVTMQALRGGRVISQLTRTLTFLADDGGYEQALAPTAPGAVALGKPVTVSYDLTNVRNVSDPALVLSSVGHYTPSAGVDDFNVAWSTPLTALKGTVTIPASAFAAGGGGLYGIGLQTSTYQSYQGTAAVYGDFRAIAVGPPAAARAEPATIDGSDAVAVTRAGPDVTIGWDVRTVPGATGAELEIMSPAPTLYGSLNTATNANGTKRDDDGFDHPSTLLKALPGTSGKEKLNLAALGLPSSLQYPVRVLALRGGAPVGQASPTTFLQYSDGDQVSGTMEGFTVTGGQALISTDTFGGASGLDLTDSATIPYNLAAGTLGGKLTDDTSGTLLSQNTGSDSATGTTLILRTPYAGDAAAEIDVVKTGTGAVVAATPLTSLPVITQGASFLESGTIDAKRGMGYAEVYDSASGISYLVKFSMTTGAMTGLLPINPSATGRTFSNITVDESTGDVFATTTGTMGPCLMGFAFYKMVKIDPATGTVPPPVPMPECTAAVVPDQKGGTVYVADGAAQPNPEGGQFPVSEYFSMDQATLTPAAAHSIGTRGPAWMSYDAAHHVLVEASLYESGVETDNNAMSEITVIDAGTGQVLSRKSVANLVNSTVAGSNFDFTSRQGLYLDPATRTGWIADAWGTGIERFGY